MVKKLLLFLICISTNSYAHKWDGIEYTPSDQYRYQLAITEVRNTREENRVRITDGMLPRDVRPGRIVYPAPPDLHRTRNHQPAARYAAAARRALAEAATRSLLGAWYAAEIEAQEEAEIRRIVADQQERQRRDTVRQNRIAAHGPYGLPVGSRTVALGRNGRLQTRRRLTSPEIQHLSRNVHAQLQEPTPPTTPSGNTSGTESESEDGDGYSFDDLVQELTTPLLPATDPRAQVHPREQ